MLELCCFVDFFCLLVLFVLIFTYFVLGFGFPEEKGEGHKVGCSRVVEGMGGVGEKVTQIYYMKILNKNA